MMNVLVLYSTHITGAHQIKNTTDAYQATIGAHNHVTALPMSDGGQGFLDAIETYATGCRRATVTVRDTHFRLKDTYYITSQDGKTAYIEAFKICGYDHTDPERNPATAFTHGIMKSSANSSTMFSIYNLEAPESLALSSSPSSSSPCPQSMQQQITS